MQNVIFDLGGVVLKWDPEGILQRFFSDDAAREVSRREIFRHPDWREIDRGTIAEHEAVLRFHQRTGRPIDEMEALVQYVKDSLQPLPETVALMEELSGHGIPLYCLSNMPATTAEHLREQHSFWPLFRGVVISGEINMLKPEPDIFHYIARQYSLVPEDTCFIDDMPENVEGARQVGFNALLFENPRQCREDLLGILGMA